MSDNNDSVRHDAPTRRDYVKYGGAVIGGGLLAGCSGDGSDTPPTRTATETATTTETQTGTPEDESWTVSMAPMGEVEFDSVPETATIYNHIWADMLVGFGHGDAVQSLNFPENYYTGYYDQLDGVSFETSELTQLYNDGLDKELFYELDADVHIMGPSLLLGNGWSVSDIEEIETNVGPFFGNGLCRTNGDPPGGYKWEVEYYTLWELTEKIGAVFREEERAAALRAVRDEMVKAITTKLPPEPERPSVGLVYFYSDKETFLPFRCLQPGTGRAQFRPLGVKDAFADSDKVYSEQWDASVDVEALLEYDPDVIIHNWGYEATERSHAMRDFLADDPLAQELTAVQTDRVYAGASPLQGPVQNLFQIEMAAKQIFPEQFGEWKGVGNHDPSERLFDRQRVADIVNGGL